MTAASSPRVSPVARAISIADSRAPAEFGQKRSSRERCQAAASLRPAVSASENRLRTTSRARAEIARARSAALSERPAAAAIGGESLGQIADLLLRAPEDEGQRQALRRRRRVSGCRRLGRLARSRRDEQGLGAKRLRRQQGRGLALRLASSATRSAAAASPVRMSSR